MTRLASATGAISKGAAKAAIHVHTHPVHHHFHHHRFSGSPVGYAGLAAAAVASWLGLPGPGEPLLIAAGILAAKNKLDIASVLLVAWVCATAGGVGGWLIGLKFGRRLLSTRGPLQKFRRAAMVRGDRIFERYPVLAIILTPSWVAGIHRVRSALYQPVNVVSALVWAVGIGLGSYYAGPPVLDIVSDMGNAAWVALVVLIVAVVLEEVIRRRRARRRRGAVQVSD